LAATVFKKKTDSDDVSKIGEGIMKLKKEYIILAVLIVGLIFYLVFQKTDRTHYRLPDVAEVAAKNISKLEIDMPGSSIELNKKDDKWTIGKQEYPADSGKVNNMLDVIEKLTVTALVSESKNFFRYGLSDDNKISVKAWEGSEMSREFDIGKAAATYQHTFVKLKGNPNVYHVRGNFRNKFDQTLDKMRDKAVLSFEQNSITEIHAKKDEQTIAATQKIIPTSEERDKKEPPEKDSQTKEPEMTWQTAEGKTLDKSKVVRLLSSLSSLKCQRYINDRKKEDFKEPICSVTLKGEKEYSLHIFPKTTKDAKNHPAISSENDYPFVLSESKVKTITSNIEELLKGTG